MPHVKITLIVGVTLYLLYMIQPLYSCTFTAFSNNWSVYTYAQLFILAANGHVLDYCICTISLADPRVFFCSDSDSDLGSWSFRGTCGSVAYV